MYLIKKLKEKHGGSLAEFADFLSQFVKKPISRHSIHQHVKYGMGKRISIHLLLALYRASGYTGNKFMKELEESAKKDKL